MRYKKGAEARQYIDEHADEVVCRYEAGESGWDISIDLCLTQAMVYKLLREKGVSMRKRGGWANVKRDGKKSVDDGNDHIVAVGTPDVDKTATSWLSKAW